MDVTTIIIVSIVFLILIILFYFRKNIIAVIKFIFKAREVPVKKEESKLSKEESKSEEKPLEPEEKEVSFGKLSRTRPVEIPKPIDRSYEEIISEENGEVPKEIKEPVEETEEVDDVKKVSAVLFGDKPIAAAIRELPPELKALILTDVLRRKDDI